MQKRAYGALPQTLTVLLVITQFQAVAQAPKAAQPAAQLPIERSLKIRVLAGKDETNDLQRLIMAPMVVQVVDQNERPVEGAEVVFRFPIRGPGATFDDGKTSRTVLTNGDGQAAATNWRSNNQTGGFQVHVTATYANQEGETTFIMSNATHVVQQNERVKRPSWWSHTWAKAAVIGGAAALIAGVVLATRGGGGGGGSTITITPGGPTVGGPH